MGDSLFSDWHQVGITAARTVVLYLSALAAVRFMGRRTVAEISAFDVVVTVALGTVVASTALPNNSTLVDGVAVLAGLLLLQVSIGALRQRFPALGRCLDFRPYVVARGSKITVRRSPLTAQLTEQDVRMMLRLHGMFDLGQCPARRVGTQWPDLGRPDRHRSREQPARRDRRPVTATAR